MTHDEIIAAAALFERREACAAQLREIDAELAYMHGAYICARNACGGCAWRVSAALLRLSQQRGIVRRTYDDEAHAGAWLLATVALPAGECGSGETCSRETKQARDDVTALAKRFQETK